MTVPSQNCITDEIKRKPNFSNTWHHSNQNFSSYRPYTRVYSKVSGLAAWSDNCEWYSSLPL